MIDLEIVDGTAVVGMGDGLNQFEAEFVAALDATLGRAVAEGATALVTVGSGKHYSNGFDLDFLGVLDPGGAREFFDRTFDLLVRVLTFPLPTVAALNGHAFGVGAILALAHDVRVMRSDRGWFCLPEIDLGMRFHPFLLGVITSRLPRATVDEAVLTGRRYGGESALEAGIVAGVAAADDLRSVAVSTARERAGKRPASLEAIKRDLHAPTLALLREQG